MLLYSGHKELHHSEASVVDVFDVFSIEEAQLISRPLSPHMITLTCIYHLSPGPSSNEDNSTTRHVISTKESICPPFKNYVQPNPSKNRQTAKITGLNNLPIYSDGKRYKAKQCEADADGKATPKKKGSRRTSSEKT